MFAKLVQTTVFFLDVLTGAINPTLAAPLKLAAAKQGLTTGTFTPGVGTTFADMTEPSFTGYSQSATIVWGAPLNETDGSETSLSPANLFRATAVTTPQTITGGFVTDGVAAPNCGILGSYKLPQTIPIQNPGDGFSAVIGWNMGGSNASSYAQINQ